MADLQRSLFGDEPAPVTTKPRKGKGKAKPAPAAPVEKAAPPATVVETPPVEPKPAPSPPPPPAACHEDCEACQSSEPCPEQPGDAELADDLAEVIGPFVEPVPVPVPDLGRPLIPPALPRVAPGPAEPDRTAEAPPLLDGREWVKASPCEGEFHGFLPHNGAANVWYAHKGPPGGWGRIPLDLFPLEDQELLVKAAQDGSVRVVRWAGTARDGEGRLGFGETARVQHG